MSIFKKLFVATALFNVALSGTAHSSEALSVVTSIQLVTSVTLIDAPAASSSATCNTLTITKTAPPSTVTVVVPPAVSGSSVVSSSMSSKDVTIQTSVASSNLSKALPTETETCVNTVIHNGQVMTVTGCNLPPGLAPPTPTSTKSLTSTTSKTETVTLSSTNATHVFTGTAIKPSGHLSHTFHMNSTKTAIATGTGGASASVSYSAPSLPPFTDAADASNVGAAVLFGGVLLAIFGA